MHPISERWAWLTNFTASVIELIRRFLFRLDPVPPSDHETKVSRYTHSYTTGSVIGRGWKVYTQAYESGRSSQFLSSYELFNINLPGSNLVEIKY